MKRNQGRTKVDQPASLRRRAERFLSQKPENKGEKIPEDMAKLVHELQVHQIELEMQNEALRKAQAEIEKSRSRYFDLYDFAPVGYFTFDQKGMILDVNLAGARLLGVERSLLLRLPFIGFLSAESCSTFHLHLKAVFSTGTKQTCELKLIRENGDSFYVSVESISSKDTEGTPFQCRSALSDTTKRKRAEEELQKAHDELEVRVQKRTEELATINKALEAEISERKRMEEALRQSQTLLSAIMENTPDPVYVKDDQSRIVMANPALAKVAGKPLEEILGKTDSEYYGDPATGQDLREHDLRVMRSGQGEVTEETVPTPDGYRTFLSSKTPYRDESGEIIGVTGISRDITEIKKAEAELRENRNKYQALIETTSDFIWEMDSFGRYTYCSPQMKKLWGLKPEEMIGKTPFDVMPAEHKDNAEESFVALVKSPQSFSGLESAAYDSHGRLIHIETSGVPFFDDDGKLLGFRGISRDITERKRAREELRKSRDQLEIIVQERTAELAQQSRILEGFFNSTITPLVFLDRSFNFIRVNEAYAKCCQRDRSEFQGHNHFEFYPNEENEAIFRKVVETKVPYQAIAEPFTFPDHPQWGTIYWDWTLTPLLDAKGEVEFLVFSLEDVTKRKQAELALHESSHYVRSLIEASIDPLVTINRNGKIMDVNRATELATGYSRDTLIGSDFSEYFTEPEKAREGYKQVFSKGFVRDYPLAIRDLSGRVINVLYNATVYKNEAGEVQGVFAAARDITELKRAEEDLKNANEQVRVFASQCLTAQETERRKIAGELHDSVAASLGAMRFRIDKTAEEMKQGHANPEALQDLGSKVAEINNDVRRIMSNLRPSVLDDLGIIAAINWFCREYQKTYSHISVETQIGVSEDEVPSSLKTPIFRISQEAMNNIAKHSKATVVSLTLQKGSGIELVIRDNGQGFDLENTKRGLGLSTMKERCTLSGGTCGIESVRRAGTTIRCTWPLA